MKEKILVTGASGFVGAEIVKQLLAQGKKVKALKRKSSNTAFLKSYEGQFEWVIGDVNDIPSLERAFEDVGYVYHSAAMISFDPAQKFKMFKVNIEGTANMVNVSLAKGIKKFLQVSSVSAFGRYDIKEAINEQTKWVDHAENTNYAIAKHRSELEVWRAHEEGLNMVITNPATILGFGDWTQGSSQIFKNVFDEISFYPTGINGFVSVEDVAKACIQLMDSDISGERFIISAENISFKDLFESIANAFGKKVPGRPLSAFIRGIGWRFYWIKSKFLGQQPLVTKETTLYTSRDYLYENDKIKKALDFKFENIEEVCVRTCKKYQEALK
ncbi:MAG: dihydroflavonol-4-reductase [Chitinophagales bacterium]|jgi:dihydroflavonol-4-reductase